MTRKTLSAMLLASLVAYLFTSCGGGGGDRGEGGGILPGPGETREFTVLPDTASAVELKSGNKLFLPAGTFTQATVIIFSDNIVGTERDPVTYPEGTESFMGYCTINNPASEANTFQKDIVLTLALRSSSSPGTKYIVYRYNPDTVKWEAFGSALAEVDSSGLKATATLPTTGIAYTIGPVGIFVGKTAEAGPPLPGGASAIVTGTVRIGSPDGEPASDVDLLLFLVQDGELVPYEFLNGESDPQNPNNHNFLRTDASGRFEMRFGKADIGPGRLYKIILARYDDRYEEAESAVFSVNEGVNPDKDFVVSPSQ